MKAHVCATREQTGDAAGFLCYLERVNIWSVNPYRHCQHGCLYCIADSQGESIPWYSADAVVPALYARLSRVPPHRELFVGALVDPYPPIEKGLGVTRRILRELVTQQRPCCVTTKSDLITRDLDLLRQHPGHCDVAFSLCTLDDDALWMLEPGAPSAGERLDAIAQLRDAGIDVTLDASPWIPGITDARELIVQRPDHVPITFAPLDLRHHGGAMTLLGHRYTQEAVNADYFIAQRDIGHIDGVSWKDPLPD